MEKKYVYIRILADTNLYVVELDGLPFFHGKKVIVHTEFGEDLGFINSFPFDKKPEDKSIYFSGKLLRYATDEDIQHASDKLAESRKARLVVQGLTQKLNLEMNITHLLMPLKGKTLVIFYTADGKVDFRELLKMLRAEFKEKIIMRQIRARDRLDSFYLDARNPVNHFQIQSQN